jgi:hypothetical protein
MNPGAEMNFRIIFMEQNLRIPLQHPQPLLYPLRLNLAEGFNAAQSFSELNAAVHHLLLFPFLPEGPRPPLVEPRPEMVQAAAEKKAR